MGLWSTVGHFVHWPREIAIISRPLLFWVPALSSSRVYKTVSFMLGFIFFNSDFECSIMTGFEDDQHRLLDSPNTIYLLFPSPKLRPYWPLLVRPRWAIPLVIR